MFFLTFFNATVASTSMAILVAIKIAPQMILWHDDWWLKMMVIMTKQLTIMTELKTSMTLTNGYYSDR